jgi:hypothetical protein
VHDAPPPQLALHGPRSGPAWLIVSSAPPLQSLRRIAPDQLHLPRRPSAASSQATCLPRRTSTPKPRTSARDAPEIKPPREREASPPPPAVCGICPQTRADGSEGRGAVGLGGRRRSIWFPPEPPRAGRRGARGDFVLHTKRFLTERKNED